VNEVILNRDTYSKASDPAMKGITYDMISEGAWNSESTKLGVSSVLPIKYQVVVAGVT
jgi:hypothetical protein